MRLLCCEEIFQCRGIAGPNGPPRVSGSVKIQAFLGTGVLWAETDTELSGSPISSCGALRQGDGPLQGPHGLPGWFSSTNLFEGIFITSLYVFLQHVPPSLFLPI